MNTRLALTICAALCSTQALAAPEKYEFDKSHTNILFFIDHLGFSDMVGQFTDYDGTFMLDQQQPENSKIDVTLKPTGIRTSSVELDKHLQKPEYFNSAAFPDIRFTSTAIKKTGEKTAEATGNVTMLGVTKPVTMKVTLNKADYHPFTQNYVAGFSAEANLKRSDFGMKESIPLVGDEVRISIETELVNMDRKKKESLTR